MEILQSGRIFLFVMVLLLSAIGYYCIDKSKKGRIPKIRNLPALTGIEEAIGRAVETGGKVLFIPGLQAVTGVRGSETISALAILSHVARQTAKLNAGLIVLPTLPQVVQLSEDIVKEAYLMEGAPDAYTEDIVRYCPGQWGLAQVSMDAMQTEKVKCNIMVGGFAGEVLAITESGTMVGAIQIGGTVFNTSQLPFFLAICDYCLLSEEMYAAGAMLSGEPVQLGSIEAQDFGKVIMIAFIAIGFLLSLFGSDLIAKLFSM